MANVTITSDSTCDLTRELFDRYEIATIPLTVTLGDNHYRDGVDIVPQDIYDYVAKTGNLPKTAAPSPTDYKEFFSPLAKKFDAVVHFNISSCISASNQNAVLAAKEFPNVYVIDSLALSTGTAVEMLYAKDLLEAGNGVKSVVETVNARRDCVQTSFVVENLEYLHKGGRCSLMQRFGANLLRLRPYIKMKDGELGVAGKFRGSRMGKVFADYVAQLAESYPTPEATRAFVTHTLCEPEDVAEAVAAVKKHFAFKEVFETVAGSTITSHCGKGTLGLLFLNDKPV